MPKLKTVEAKHKLKQLGINQAKLALLIGVSSNTISAQFKRLYVTEIYRLAIIGIEFEYNLKGEK